VNDFNLGPEGQLADVPGLQGPPGESLKFNEMLFNLISFKVLQARKANQDSLGPVANLENRRQKISIKINNYFIFVGRSTWANGRCRAARASWPTGASWTKRAGWRRRRKGRMRSLSSTQNCARLLMKMNGGKGIWFKGCSISDSI